MHVRPNPAREKLKRGEPIFLSATRLPEPGLCEILGYAGFDAVMLDGEHGAANGAALERMILGCFAGNTVPIARLLHSANAEEIMHVLDLGVQGILMPHCRTAADALALRNAALHAPEGKRGVGPGRGKLWGRVPNSDYFAQVNETILTIGLIEDVEAIDNCEAIAAAGLDCLWIGPGDLAADYGVLGQTDHPKVIAGTERLLAACLKHGTAAGIGVSNLAGAKDAIQRGYRVIGFGSGIEQYIMQTSRAFLEPLGR